VTLFAGLLDLRFAVSEMPISGVPDGVWPEEAELVAPAVERRKREFLTGRVCARKALAALGATTGAILSGSDRLPLWPTGFVGSITHTDRHCAAAVARHADGVRSVGIDLEPADALPTDIWETVCRPEELARLDEIQSVEERGLMARTLFSAKECAFKCQYPLTRRMLEFHEVAVALDMANGTFAATLPGFEGPGILHGRVRIADSHVACAMIM